MSLISESLIPYSVILFNAIVFWLLRKLLQPITPRKFKLLIHEFISTIELCSGCAELGVVWAKHGNIGLAIALFLACMWWADSFEIAEASPCGPVEDMVLLKQPITRPNIMYRLIGQFLGAYFTAKWTDMVWRYHLTAEHVHFHGAKCESALQTTILNAFIAEMLTTFVSRIIALESSRITNYSLAKTINSVTTVILSISAQDSSGGFFNPILASALTLNCEGNNLIEHIVVYWIGSIVGSLVARYIHVYTVTKYRKLRTKRD